MNAEQYRAVIGWFNARPVAKMALRVVSRGAVALVYLGYLGMLAWLVWHRMGQFCPVAIFLDSLVYLKAMHLRDLAFLLVLEDDSIPFNRYNLRLYWLFILLLFYECFFVSLCLLTGIILE